MAMSRHRLRMTGTDRGERDDPSEDALRRWLGGQDAALDEWLDGRLRRIQRKPRTLAGA